MVDPQRFAVLGGGRWHCRQATVQRKSPTDGTQESAGPGIHISSSLT